MSTEPPTRTIHTFKHREDGEAAVALLAQEGIQGTLLDLATGPGMARTSPDAVRLVVDTEFAAKAEALLRSNTRQKKESLTKSDEEQQRRERERQRYARDRESRPVRKGFDPTSGIVISLALLGAFGVIVYMLTGFSDDEQEAAKSLPKARFANMDLNGDRKVDHKRYLDSQGRPLREELDFNYDGVFDVVQSYEEGRMKERRLDLDGNGVWDEFFYFDYLGRPFYSQVIMNGKGGVSKRTFYRDEQEFADFTWPEEVQSNPADIPDGGECWPYLVLTASKADGVFEEITEFDSTGKEKSKRPLAPGAPESVVPPFPQRPERR